MSINNFVDFPEEFKKDLNIEQFKIQDNNNNIALSEKRMDIIMDIYNDY